MAKTSGLKIQSSNFKMKSRKLRRQTHYTKQREEFREAFYQEQAAKFNVGSREFGRRAKPPSGLKRVRRWFRRRRARLDG